MTNKEFTEIMNNTECASKNLDGLLNGMKIISKYVYLVSFEYYNDELLVSVSGCPSFVIDSIVECITKDFIKSEIIQVAVNLAQWGWEVNEDEELIWKNM